MRTIVAVKFEWKVYKAVEDMAEFFKLARAVSVMTYQEKLLDADLPKSEKFFLEMEQLARQQRLRRFFFFMMPGRCISLLSCQTFRCRHLRLSWL